MSVPTPATPAPTPDGAAAGPAVSPTTAPTPSATPSATHSSTSGEKEFAGRIAVVTGGARGLGYAMASGLARNGADIALLDVNSDVETSAATLAQEMGVRATGVVVDVTKEDSVVQALATVAERLGVPTMLVNSAGISHNAPALETSLEEFERVIDINLVGTWLCCREFARNAIAAGQQGVIVNISSMSGFVVNVPQPQAAYNASKAGVTQVTASLAIEWLDQGIRVNAIGPGYFATEMTKIYARTHPEVTQEWIDRTPAHRMGQPEELGDLVVYLCSEKSRFMVGQTVFIDGGYMLI